MSGVVMPPGAAPILERAARERAWLDFLVEVRKSLLVWEIDAEVREGCEPVPVWLRGCFDDLGRWAK